MRKHNFAFVDIETTGLNLIKNEIIEIGCVITDSSLKVIEEFELKIKPEHLEYADKAALKVNHYNEEDWANAKDLEKALKIFSKKTKDCIMVAHNIAFDYSFLEYSFAQNGVKNLMHYHKLDTVSIALAKLHDNKEVEHFSLRELCKYFDIKTENLHTGLGDARATHMLYKKLINM